LRGNFWRGKISGFIIPWELWPFYNLGPKRGNSGEFPKKKGGKGLKAAVGWA